MKIDNISKSQILAIFRRKKNIVDDSFEFVEELVFFTFGVS